MDEKHISVAIDGPAAAGKSTVARRVAERLSFTYIDTGAMYRAVTLACIRAGLDPKDEGQAVSLLPSIQIEFDEAGRTLLNGEDVSEQIRQPLVSGNVSYIAAMKPIRLALVEMQRKMADSRSVVMDGRDIGPTCFPMRRSRSFRSPAWRRGPSGAMRKTCRKASRRALRRSPPTSGRGTTSTPTASSLPSSPLRTLSFLIPPSFRLRTP